MVLTVHSSAVIDMVDWERHDITHMLKNLPDVTNRVIGVINKCDLKFPKANDFVCGSSKLLTMLTKPDFRFVAEYRLSVRTIFERRVVWFA